MTQMDGSTSETRTGVNLDALMCCTTPAGHDGEPDIIKPCPKNSVSSTSTTTTEVGLWCLLETVSGLTQCVLETCAVEANECIYSTIAYDTCAQFESTCNGLLDECCSGGCKTAAANLLDCATGDICDPFTCGARRALQAEPSPPFSRKLELGTRRFRLRVRGHNCVHKMPHQ